MGLATVENQTLKLRRTPLHQNTESACREIPPASRFCIVAYVISGERTSICLEWNPNVMGVKNPAGTSLEQLPMSAL